MSHIRFKWSAENLCRMTFLTGLLIFSLTKIRAKKRKKLRIPYSRIMSINMKIKILFITLNSKWNKIKIKCLVKILILKWINMRKKRMIKLKILNWILIRLRIPSEARLLSLNKISINKNVSLIKMKKNRCLLLVRKYPIILDKSSQLTLLRQWEVLIELRRSKKWNLKIHKLLQISKVSLWLNLKNYSM